MSEGSAEKVNMAFIAAIVAVATIGGFMFGYDSGVINGTQKGLESAFDLGKLGIGVNVGTVPFPGAGAVDRDRVELLLEILTQLERGYDAWLAGLTAS